MAKFCMNCGSELNEQQEVCLKCGVLIKKEENTKDTPSEKKNDKHATTGLTLGLISIVAWIIPLFGYPVTICGIVNSAKGIKSNNNNGKAIAGLILSIIFLIVTLINSIIGILINLGTY